MNSQKVSSVVTPAPVLRSSSATEDGEAGVQNPLRRLDSRLRGNDTKGCFSTFCETVLIPVFHHSIIPLLLPYCFIPLRDAQDHCFIKGLGDDLHAYGQAVNGAAVDAHSRQA